MKKSFLLTLLATGLTFAAQSATAAQGGTITFNGKIVETTCQVKTGSENKTVTLPTVAKSAFSQVGSTAGTVGFTIDLENCSTPANGARNVKAFFYANSKTNAAGRVINTNTTTGTSVDLELLDKDGISPIDINKDGADAATGQSQQFTAIPVVSLRYFVRYYATNASVAAGDVTGMVDYILAYK